MAEVTRCHNDFQIENMASFSLFFEAFLSASRGIDVT